MKKYPSIITALSIIAFVFVYQVSPTFAEISQSTYTIQNIDTYEGVDPITGSDVVVATFDIKIDPSYSAVKLYKDGIVVTNNKGVAGITNIQSTVGNYIVENGSYYNIPAGKTSWVKIMSIFAYEDMPLGSRNINVSLNIVPKTYATPHPPTSVKVVKSSVCGGKVDISWNGSGSNADTYNVYKSSSKIAVGLSSTTTSYTDTIGATNYPTTSYFVSSVNSLGEALPTATGTVSVQTSIQSASCVVTPILRTLVKATPLPPKINPGISQQIGDAGGSIVAPPTSQIIDCKFDATKYANYYPDLKAAYGSNTSALTTHYIQHGLFEGRTPCGSDMPSCKFDALTYANLNPDLKAAYGSNTSALTTHYTQHGIAEGRDVCQTKVTPTPVTDATPATKSTATSGMASAYESVKSVFSQVLKVLLFWR